MRGNVSNLFSNLCRSQILYYIFYRVDFCRTSQFVSDFPPELSGIIYPYEFEQSLANINRARRSTPCEILLTLISISCLLVIIVLIIVAARLVSVDRPVCIPAVSIGVGIMLLTIFMYVFARVWRVSARNARLENAVNEESMKYSTGKPVPTRWRLEKKTKPVRSFKSTSIHKSNFVSNHRNESYDLCQ